MIATGVADDFDCTTTELDEKGFHIIRSSASPRPACRRPMAAGPDIWALSIQRSLPAGTVYAGRETEACSSSKDCKCCCLARPWLCSRQCGRGKALEPERLAVSLLNRSGQVLRLNRAAQALRALSCALSRSGSFRRIRKRPLPWIALCIRCYGRAQACSINATGLVAAAADTADTFYPVRLSTASANVRGLPGPVCIC